MQRRDDARMFDERNLDRLLERAWQKRFERAPWLQMRGLDADNLTVSGDAVFQLRLRGVEFRPRLSDGGLRLRHVGAGHLADLKTVPGLLELLLQHGDVVLRRFTTAVSRSTFI